MRRYVGLAALRAFALVALALTGLFSLLEFVEQLASVGQGRYHVLDAVVFVLLTSPSRLLVVTPVSLLIGCLTALGGMARNSELAAMLSLGISERRIIGSVLALVLPLSAFLFLLMQVVIPPSQQLAWELRAAALASPPARGNDSGFWTRHDRQYLNVERFERGNMPVGIDLYSFRADGSLESVIEADRAIIGPDGTWTLANVSRRHVTEWKIETDHLPTLTWHSFISPGQIRFLVVPLDSVAPTTLFRHIRSLPPDQKAPRDEQVLWTKVSLPLVLVAMVMAAAPFVFGSPRSQSSGQHLARGVSVGIVFALGQQILSRLGLLLGLSPALVAVVPPLLVIGLAIALLRLRHRPARSTSVSPLSPAT